MKQFTVFCDDYQEGIWFKRLDPHLSDARLSIIPASRSNISAHGLDGVLKYDRPDIILWDHKRPVLVLERTTEVPSGHNAGQRYGRLLAAAEERIPVVYICPYMAYKHGGITAGPRYMNLRLFYSLKNISEQFNTAVTTINWPVDSRCELLKTEEKDARVKEYLKQFFSYYDANGSKGLTEYIRESDFQAEQYQEQVWFAKHNVRSPQRYSSPPKSVELLSPKEFRRRCGEDVAIPDRKILVYHVGMRYVRPDPYAGMAALYKCLYGQDGAFLVLRFERIRQSSWYQQKAKNKTYRMFKQFADAIWFQDGFVFRDAL